MRYLLTILLLYCYTSLAAQKIVCGNAISSIHQTHSNNIDSITARLSYHGNYRSDSLSIIIPVVVHIVWHTDAENISDALILSQIDALNRDFNQENTDIQYVPDEFKPVIANVGIRFCLAAKDPDGNPTTGIIREYSNETEIGTSPTLFHSAHGGSDAWDINRYLNVWVANTGTSIAGFGIYPWADSADRSGIVVNSSYFGINGMTPHGMGRVCVHEVGHYLGLIHTWGDVFDCSSDDGVADTPPQAGPFYHCPSYPQPGCSDNAMFMNFMDYVDDPCMLLFTEGQKQRMLSMLFAYRPSLLNLNVQCIHPDTAQNITAIAFPNPNTGSLTILFPNPPMDILTLHIYNDLGELLIDLEPLINTEIKIDMSKFPTGIYLCEIKNKIHVISRSKLIKQ